MFDPIDGTTNYAHGLPIFCSSLALEIDGEAVVGAIYDPNRRELFTAERGHGARMNGVPLRVSRTAALIDSLLVTGFHYDIHKNRADLIELFSALLGRARAVRRLGSAAIDLCYVAAGRFDGFWEKQLHPWDVAAGALIVSEAGGTVTTMDGSAHQSRKASVLATNGLIHQEMLNKIREVSNSSAGCASARLQVEIRVPVSASVDPRPVSLIRVPFVDPRPVRGDRRFHRNWTRVTPF